MKRVLGVVIGLTVLAGTVPMRAHHSYAGFSDQVVSIEGTLERVMFANPHVILRLRAKDSAVYTVQWVAALTLENRGMTATDLKPGDVLVVSGTPARDPAVHEMARIREVRRTRDGWRWVSNDAGRGPAIRPAS